MKKKKSAKETNHPPGEAGGMKETESVFALNSEMFMVMLNTLMAEEAATFKDILTPVDKEHGGPWRMNREFVAKMQEHTALLCRHYVRRASMFGQYRTDPDMLKTKKRPPPMECRESDFNLAWQTLEQDSK